MDIQTANKFDEAAGGMIQAAELYMKAVEMNAEIQGMIALNKERSDLGHSLAYGEEAFIEVVKKYNK